MAKVFQTGERWSIVILGSALFHELKGNLCCSDWCGGAILACRALATPLLSWIWTDAVHACVVCTFEGSGGRQLLIHSLCTVLKKS